MLAVVVACEKFHSYVFGKKFIVESDHKPLEMIHLKNLRACPPEDQAEVIHAISPISVKLGQIEGHTQ